MDKFLDQINFIKQCRQYHLKLWECPSFLFLMMGQITIIAMIGTYFIAQLYAEMEVVIFLVASVTVITFVIGNMIVDSFTKLAEVNKLKSEFVSIASHQLRAPISSIKWSLNLLLSGKIGEVRKEHLKYLEIIRDNNESMKELVGDLLDVSRIENDGIKMSIEPSSLAQLTKEVISHLSPLAKANNITVNFKAQPNIPLISIDPERIKSVIQNLLDNAIRYIKGRGLINIEIFNTGRMLKFSIADNGVGIPKHQQHMIFKKFFRAENIMKHETRGTGLGLFISKAVIHEHDGEIGFKSEERGGSTFWFTLPIK